MDSPLRAMLNVLMYVVSVYLLVCLFLFLLQGRMIFLAPPQNLPLYETHANHSWSFQSGEWQMQAWDIPVQKTNSKVLLYFGGNAEDAVYMNFEAAEFNVSRVFSVNYPGYGHSQGSADEQSLYAMGLAAYDAIVAEKKVSPEQLIVMGRSLGAAVAVHVALNRKVFGIILSTPFDSLASVAKFHYRVFPVEALLKYRFDTAEKLASVNVPILILAAGRDEVVPQSSLQRLLTNAPAQTIRHIYADAGHNTIQLYPQYYADINRFLSGPVN